LAVPRSAITPGGAHQYRRAGGPVRLGSRPNTPDLVIKPDAAAPGTYKVHRLFADHLGSPRLAVNVNNKDDVPYRVDYSAFGVPEWKGSTPEDFGWIAFGFAGGLYDHDTGLVRFGARDYDPSIGRWISKDPIRFGGGQTNIYVYVDNDPINRADPFGLTDQEFGNLLKCSGNILACALVCDVATIGCYACLAKVFGDVDGSSCYQPFGFPDPQSLPPSPPDCPPGTHRGLPGWGNAICEPDDCTGGGCVCQ
jgi:RHS repeat-associated protein